MALLVAGFVGYSAGERSATRHLTVRTGDAYVGDHQASMTVDGWTYSVAGSVAWMDESGSLHQSGWPACLAQSGSTVKVRLGEITATGPNGAQTASRPVVWIDCRGAVLTN